MNLLSRMKKPLYVIAGWVLSLILVFALPFDIPAITGFAFLLFYLTGFLLLLIFLVGLLGKTKRRENAIGILLVLVILFVTFNKGVRWGAAIHLLTNKGRYEAVLKKISSTQSTAEREKICGDDCGLLSDEPVRVSFHYCHWFLNWRDIVYDPTGAVKVEYLPPERRMSVYFRRGEHLSGDWYLCHFAD